MKNLWRSYRSKNENEDKVTKTKQSSLIDDLSLTNDSAATVAKRLEFFLPEFKTAFPLKYRIIFMMVWSVLVTLSLIPHYIDNSMLFVQNFLFEFILMLLTIMPAFIILDSCRPYLIKKSILQVNVQVLLIFICASICSISLMYIFLLYFGTDFNDKDFALKVLIHMLKTAIITQAFISYCISRYQELQALSNSFDLRLEVQNEIIKARMSPHFFFNTLNGLISVVESDPKQAVTALTNVSTLFRASLSEADEISFDQEVDLCNVFFDVNQMRFHDKLDVVWDLPDEDEMYDMTITGLTLQSVLEKISYHVVELTTEKVKVDISVTWKNHLVTILIHVELPKKTLLVRHDLTQQMNFDIQAQRLRYHFGKASEISTRINHKNIEVAVIYPLHDPYVVNTASL